MPQDVIGTTLSKKFLGSTEYLLWWADILYAGSTDYPIATSDGLLVPKYKRDDIVWSSGGLDVSTMSNSGITRIYSTGGGDPSTSPVVITLAAPVSGCEKTIHLESTAAFVNTVDVDCGSGVRISGSSDGRWISFSSLATIPQSITLQGLSTALWGVKCVNSTVGSFSLATGIRASTAARTS